MYFECLGNEISIKGLLHELDTFSYDDISLILLYMHRARNILRINLDIETIQSAITRSKYGSGCMVNGDILSHNLSSLVIKCIYK